MPQPILHILAFAVGVALVYGVLRSAIQTIILPRSVNDPISRKVFLAMRRVFDLRARFARGYVGRDRVLAFYAPVALLALVAVWMLGVLVGYAAIYWALGTSSWSLAFTQSGSSLLTLGFAAVHEGAPAMLTFTEAFIGLVLVALLISYLPTIYSAFSRREAAVTMLEIRAGIPPSALTMLERYQRIHGLDRLGLMWTEWERWFTELEETHTSLAVLNFFRSPQPERSWITAAGTVLDAAALVASTVDVPHDPQTDLCIRAGFIALRHIAEFFKIPYNPTPKPDDPISISRAEYDAACDRLAAANLPLTPDRERAWRDFAGWRVNYDDVLIALCRLMAAPDALWSSDRLKAR